MSAIRQLSVSDVMVLAGVLAILGGIFTVSKPAACIVLGVMLLLGGVMQARAETGKGNPQ